MPFRPFRAIKRRAARRIAEDAVERLLDAMHRVVEEFGNKYELKAEVTLTLRVQEQEGDGKQEGPEQ